MVGSAVAYNKAQTGTESKKTEQQSVHGAGHVPGVGHVQGGGQVQGVGYGQGGGQVQGVGYVQGGHAQGNRHAGAAAMDSGQNMQGYHSVGQEQGEGAKYKDTFHQMMMWRY